MRLSGRARSANVEDRRGRGIGRTGVGLGCGGILVVIAISLLTGADPLALLQQLESVAPSEGDVGAPPAGEAPSDALSELASVVLADTEETWRELMPGLGQPYQEPVLVLFQDQVRSACGFASAAVGPFYCPADHRVYLDLVFFDQLHRQLGAPGDFAQAYVIAHEIGHHVQNLVGISGQVQARRQQVGGEEANDLSVRLELQADCFAGVWAHWADRKGLLEPGDIEEGLGAASAIGDDRLQRRAQGYVVPESFTHGSSEQRVEWLRRGLASGDPETCNTFG